MDLSLKPLEVADIGTGRTLFKHARLAVRPRVFGFVNVTPSRHQSSFRSRAAVTLTCDQPR